MVLFKVREIVDKEAKYLKAECGVRYWDDATVNGIEEKEDEPTIPFANGDTWSPLIDLDNGLIVDWPDGTDASVHYKVCDDGRYSLLDAERNVIITVDGYVPSIMCPKDSGYGDYVIMDIGPDGKIDKWNADLSGFEGDRDND